MLAKSKLSKIEVLISKALIDWVFSHNEFVLINNILKEYNQIKKRNQKFKGLIKFMKDLSLFIKHCFCIVCCVEKIQKVKIQKLQGQKQKHNAFIKMCSVG